MKKSGKSLESMVVRFHSYNGYNLVFTNEVV